MSKIGQLVIELEEQGKIEFDENTNLYFKTKGN